MFKPESIHIVNLLSHAETVFNFRQNRAVLVTGRNLDKGGQKSNGSGKSSLAEAISVAMTGGSIRNVKTRELIRNGCTAAEVTIVLNNSRTGEIMTVWRKLHSSTSKSSECKIWIGEEEVKTCSDINAYNKFILDRIGISKEDFFNFYLITKEHYQPFLVAGDTEKKRVINRFSGADSIDSVETEIDADSTRKQQELTVLGKELIQIQTRSQVLFEQLEKEKAIQDPTKIQLQRQELIEKEESLRGDLGSLGEHLLTLYKDREEKEKLTKTPRIDYTKEKEAVEIRLKENRQQQEALRLQLNAIKTKYKDEEKEISDGKLECDTEIRRAKSEKSNLQEEVEHINAQLQGLIECPSCHYKFTLRDKEFTVETAELRVNQCKISIESIEFEIKSWNEVRDTFLQQGTDLEVKIEAERVGIRKEIETIQRDEQLILGELSKISDKELDQMRITRDVNSAFNRANLEVSSWEDKERNLQSQLKQIGDKITLLKPDLTKVNELTEQREEQLQKEQECLVKIEKATLEKQAIDEWYTNFKRFKSTLANKSIKNIQDYNNLFLEAIGSNITIEIDGYKELANKKLKEEITTIVKRDGFDEGSYGKFSAGERARIDICNVLGMQTLINLNCPTGGLDLLYCDETLDSMDIEGLQLIIEALQSLEQTVMIVSQNEVQAQNSSTIIVQKQGGISKILN